MLSPREFRELQELTSAPNWNDESDRIIPARDWDVARQFLLALPSALQSAHVAPCGDGTIHLTWWSPNRERATIELDQTLAHFYWRSLTRDHEVLTDLTLESARDELIRRLL